MAEMNTATTDEEIRDRVIKDLKNKIVPTPAGRQFAALAGIPTANPKRCIYLLRSMDEKKEKTLWNVEVLDEEENIRMWPYDGADSEELTIRLLELHLKTAFDGIDET